ncbi:GNAT family N-acetyltransferase [Pseudidiomarina aestuarii]|uniref:GNAT family N-acetyltransferase n=1 Tax=Pseudidiomarina aestuarii TaxID=624146 RepID=UPI003A9850CB
MYQLILPTADLQQSYIDYITELGDEERYPFPLDFDHSDFPALLQRIENFRLGIDIPEGFVQSTTLWLVSGNDIVGCTNIRHRLNAKIEHCGGHIGLGIRPRYRGQGLGIELMQRSINKAREFGVQTVHIHCHTDNEPSRRMIEACGGLLHSTITVGEEHVSRYLVR